MIYINGDSHSAGAELVNGFCFAEDDPRYLAWGRRAHPECIPHTFGYKLANSLNQPFFCDAESASSNDRILRTTRKFISETKNKRDLFVIIGWSTFEREEWLWGEDYLQVTASGTDAVPDEWQQRYKDWVIAQTPQELARKRDYWADTIYDFHKELQQQEIKHLFFNSYSAFDLSKYTWDGCFVSETYTDYLTSNGYQTVAPDSYHFGKDAHIAWYKVLQKLVLEFYQPKQGLTENKKQGIITKAKVQTFTGFNR